MFRTLTERIRRRMRRLYWQAHAVLRHAIDGSFDRRYGIETRRMVSARELRSRDPLPRESWGYMGTPPRQFNRLLRALAVRKNDYHFVDVGSGKGRVTILAAMSDFRAVTGIELSRSLHDVALKNVEAVRNFGGMKCEPELLNMDALDYEFPLSPLLLYVYNPFKRRAMEEFVSRIAETYRKAPRHILFAYRNPTCARVFKTQSLFREIKLNGSRLPRGMRLFEIPSGSMPHTDRPRPAHQATREFTNRDAPYFIIEALKGRGIPYRHVRQAEITRPAFLRREMISFELSGVTYYYDSQCRLSLADPAGKSVPGPIIDGPAAYQVTQKGLTSAVLQQHGIRVPNGTTLPSQAKRQAALFFSALSSKAERGLCVKPNASSSGRSVHVGIRSLDAFQAAFVETGKRHDHILIEETVPGVVYRFFCVAGRVIAVHFSIPASVTGDGIHSISELVAIKNASRECFPIRIDLSARRLLEKARYKLDDVPENGAVVSLGEVSNFNLGADIVDATDDVHPSYVALAEKAVSAFPGLVLCGVDMTLEAPKSPAGENYHVLELNCCPGLWAHYNPDRGEARPVAEAIIDYLSRNGSQRAAIGVDVRRGCPRQGSD